MPSVAVQIIVSIIPIVSIVMGSVLIFFYFFWTYKERRLMIEKGILKQNPFDFELFCLSTGFVLSGIGICLTLFFYLKEGFNYSLLSGLIPLAIGVSLLLVLVVWRKLRSSHPSHNVSELSSHGQILR